MKWLASFAFVLLFTSTIFVNAELWEFFPDALGNVDGVKKIVFSFNLNDPAKPGSFLPYPDPSQAEIDGKIYWYYDLTNYGGGSLFTEFDSKGDGINPISFKRLFVPLDIDSSNAGESEDSLPSGKEILNIPPLDEHFKDVSNPSAPTRFARIFFDDEVTVYYSPKPEASSQGSSPESGGSDSSVSSATVTSVSFLVNNPGNVVLSLSADKDLASYDFSSLGGASFQVDSLDVCASSLSFSTKDLDLVMRLNLVGTPIEYRGYFPPDMAFEEINKGFSVFYASPQTVYYTPCETEKSSSTPSDVPDVLKSFVATPLPEPTEPGVPEINLIKVDILPHKISGKTVFNLYEDAALGKEFHYNDALYFRFGFTPVVSKGSQLFVYLENVASGKKTKLCGYVFKDDNTNEFNLPLTCSIPALPESFTGKQKYFVYAVLVPPKKEWSRAKYWETAFDPRFASIRSSDLDPGTLPVVKISGGELFKYYLFVDEKADYDEAKVGIPAQGKTVKQGIKITISQKYFDAANNELVTDDVTDSFPNFEQGDKLPVVWDRMPVESLESAQYEVTGISYTVFSEDGSAECSGQVDETALRERLNTCDATVLSCSPTSTKRVVKVGYCGPRVQEQGGNKYVVVDFKVLLDKGEEGIEVKGLDYDNRGARLSPTNPKGTLIIKKVPKDATVVYKNLGDEVGSCLEIKDSASGADTTISAVKDGISTIKTELISLKNELTALSTGLKTTASTPIASQSTFTQTLNDLNQITTNRLQADLDILEAMVKDLETVRGDALIDAPDPDEVQFFYDSVDDVNAIVSNLKKDLTEVQSKLDEATNVIDDASIANDGAVADSTAYQQSVTAGPPEPTLDTSAKQKRADANRFSGDASGKINAQVTELESILSSLETNGLSTVDDAVSAGELVLDSKDFVKKYYTVSLKTADIACWDLCGEQKAFEFSVPGYQNGAEVSEEIPLDFDCKRTLMIVTTKKLVADGDYSKNLADYRRLIDRDFVYRVNGRYTIPSSYVVLGSEQAEKYYGVKLSDKDLSDPKKLRVAVEKIRKLVDPSALLIVGGSDVFPQYPVLYKGTKILSDDGYGYPLPEAGEGKKTKKLAFQAPELSVVRLPAGKGDLTAVLPTKILKSQLTDSSSDYSRNNPSSVFTGSCEGNDCAFNEADYNVFIRDFYATTPSMTDFKDYHTLYQVPEYCVRDESGAACSKKQDFVDHALFDTSFVVFMTHGGGGSEYYAFDKDNKKYVVLSAEDFTKDDALKAQLAGGAVVGPVVLSLGSYANSLTTVGAKSSFVGKPVSTENMVSLALLNSGTVVVIGSSGELRYGNTDFFLGLVADSFNNPAASGYLSDKFLVLKQYLANEFLSNRLTDKDVINLISIQYYGLPYTRYGYEYAV